MVDGRTGAGKALDGGGTRRPVSPPSSRLRWSVRGMRGPSPMRHCQPEAMPATPASIPRRKTRPKGQPSARCCLEKLPHGRTI